MSEITKTQVQNPKSDRQILWLFLFVLIVIVYLFGLSIPLLGPDEPRYSQVAREMFERGDWVTPTLGGANWFEKPALLYWLQIAFYNLFGVSEFAARFGSALFGLGTVFSLWILGKAIEKAELNNETHRNFPNWLTIIAASSIGLIAFSRGASFDIILTFPITAALVCFFVYDLKSGSSTKNFAAKYLFGFYFFIGVAMLAKGLIGIVFPIAIVSFYFLLTRRFPKKFFIFSLFWGTILSVLVAAIWYVPMYQTNGWTFIDEFFIQHHFARYTSNKYQHPQPFPFFFWVLPLMTLPWLPFFLAAIWKFIKTIIARFKEKDWQSEETPVSKLKIFAFAWLVVPLVFFSFSGSKLPGYILPALPAALILTAEYVYQFVRNNEKRKLAVQATAFSTFLIVLVILQFFVLSFARNDTTKYLIETADASGYQNAKIMNLHTISHNAEFYGAGRLIRDADGKLKRHFGVTQVAEALRQPENGDKILVLVPLEYLHELPESDLFDSQILASNSELAIVGVKLKPTNP